MTCAFDLAHYAELLAAAKAGGYRFAAFGEGPRPGDLLLRHDVDLSLDAALRLAELEEEAGATATYFLMTESVFYNLASNEGVTAIACLRELEGATHASTSTSSSFAAPSARSSASGVVWPYAIT